MSQHLNSIQRFRRLSVHDMWPQCIICREDVSTGFTIWTQTNPSDLEAVTVCDACLNKSKKTGWAYEVAESFS